MGVVVGCAGMGVAVGPGDCSIDSLGVAGGRAVGVGAQTSSKEVAGGLSPWLGVLFPHTQPSTPP